MNKLFWPGDRVSWLARSRKNPSAIFADRGVVIRDVGLKKDTVHVQLENGRVVAVPRDRLWKASEIGFYG